MRSLHDGKVLVIGGGVAGMQAAIALATDGIEVLLLEKGSELGGRLLRSHRTYPSLSPAKGMVDRLREEVRAAPSITVLTGSKVVQLERGERFSAEVEEASGKCLQRRVLEGDAIIVASGLEVVDAGQIPELGFGRFPDAVTSEQFQGMMRDSDVKGLLRPSDSRPVRTLVFIQCVGSRVEKRGVPYCSAVCCGNAIKDALLVREMDNSVLVYVLYIDIRTQAKGCEALYKKARERGVRFIRGQPSMVVRKAASNRLLVCGENTLLKELYEIPADLVVLSVGLELGQDTKELLLGLGVRMDVEGLPSTQESDSVSTSVPGVFVAGSCEAPKDVKDSLAQGSQAAQAAARYLRKGDGPD